MKFGFKSQTRIRSVFNSFYRDKKQKIDQVIYRYNCEDCNSAYIGQTARNVNIRMHLKE